LTNIIVNNCNFN